MFYSCIFRAQHQRLSRVEGMYGGQGEGCAAEKDTVVIVQGQQIPLNANIEKWRKCSVSVINLLPLRVQISTRQCLLHKQKKTRAFPLAPDAMLSFTSRECGEDAGEGAASWCWCAPPSPAKCPQLPDRGSCSLRW